MSRRALSAVLATAAAAALLAGCTENLTTPSECPELCPGEQVPVQSVVIEPVLDTVFPLERSEGYGDRRTGPTIRVTTYEPGATADDPLVGTTDLGLVAYFPRPDSIPVRDTARPVTGIDSVAISFTVQGRDSAARGLALLLYRAPTTIDTSASFEQLAALIQPANAFDTIPVPDTLEAGLIRTVLAGDDLARLSPTPGAEDSLVFVLALAADRPTGIRLVGPGGAGAASAPRIVSYARAQVGDTVVTQQLVQSLRFRTFVSRVPEPIVPDMLSVGGAPASRVLVDFELPPLVRDSARIVRATLELTPQAPFTGLLGDSAAFEARVPILDLGPKSPLYPRSSVTPGHVAVQPGADTTITMEVTNLVRVWLADSTRPSSFVLSVFREGSTFTRGTFFSSAAPDPAVRPRLRIDYVLPFDFEAP